MYGCGEQEAGVASGSGWNLWVWLLGVVLRRYIDFLILLIPTPLVSVLFAAASLLFVHFTKNEIYYMTVTWNVIRRYCCHMISLITCNRPCTSIRRPQ